MADRDRLRLTLELEVGSEPIVGSLSTDGRRYDFSGWLGLATALERAISTAADAPLTDAHSARVLRAT
jgi:hypothetical protein